jgi:crotonobetainyl-CoA:carnitine CoA-transferase CaiB-like acyl-CoA transferase
VLKRKEVIDHPVIKANDLIIELDHPVAGKIRQTRPAARFSKSELEQGRGAPQLGEHNEEMLIEIGYTNEEIESLRAEGVIR